MFLCNALIELNLRHQDIVNAIVARLKQTHQQEMEECLANAITDTVLKVEVARLEVEKEYETKFNELRENSELEIEKLKKLNEDDVSKLEALYKKEVEQRELLEKQYDENNEASRARHEEDVKKQLTVLQEEMNKEHGEKMDKMREVIVLKSSCSKFSFSGWGWSFLPFYILVRPIEIEAFMRTRLISYRYFVGHRRRV